MGFALLAALLQTAYQICWKGFMDRQPVTCQSWVFYATCALSIFARLGSIHACISDKVTSGVLREASMKDRNPWWKICIAKI